MATEVERLVTLLEARITGYERELKKANQQANRSAKAIEDRFNLMNRNVTRAFAKFGIGLSAGALVAFAKSAVATGDAVAKSARDVEFSAAAYQEYRYAAGRAGVETGAFDSALVKFNRTLGQAQRGGEAQSRLFTLLGVDIRDASGAARDSESVFRDSADALGRVADGSVASSIGLDLVGKGNARMVQFMRQGSAEMDRMRVRARELGLVISDEMVARAEVANDEIEDMGQVLKVAGMNLALEFMPAMQDFARLITDPAFISGTHAAAENLGEMIGWMARNKDVVLAVAGALGGLKVAGPKGAVAGAVAGFTAGGGLDELKIFEQRLASLREERDRLVDSLAGKTPIVGDLLLRNLDADIARFETRVAALRASVTRPAAPAAAAAAAPSAPLPPLVIDPAFDKLPALEKYIAGLERAAQLEGELTSEKQLQKSLLEGQAILTDAEGKKLRDLSAAEKQRITGAVAAADAAQAKRALDDIDIQIAGLRRLAVAYAQSREAGLAMESRLTAEAEARKNAGVGVDVLTGAIERERMARERVDAVRTLAETDRNTANLLAEADALAEATIRWNEYTGAFEINDRAARILAETHRLLAGNTQMSADEARAAATAQVDAAEKMKTAGDKTAREANLLNEYQSALKSSVSGLVGDLRRGEDATTAFANALSRLSDRLLDLALDEAFSALFKSTGPGAAGGAGGGASGAAAGAAGSVASSMFSSMLASMFHEGGVAGQSGGARRSVSPAVFAGARRYHAGGIAGLNPGEVPAILKKGEPVLKSMSALRAIAGMGASASAAPSVNVPVTVYNAFDAPGFFSAALSTPQGQKAVLNFVKDNPDAFRGAMR